ncbi:hypothetical protein PMAYCL1PPCAC_25739, partial [Pristionchus mayeri]
NCNTKIPMFNITKRGKGECYLKSPVTETSKCWGDYCYWSGENQRGCIDAAGADENFQLRLGESSYNSEYMVICKGNYCNSDYKFPNGTIVGPSAARRFTSSLDSALSLSTLFAITL